MFSRISHIVIVIHPVNVSEDHSDETFVARAKVEALKIMVSTPFLK